MKKLVLLALVLGGCVSDIPVEQPEGSTDTVNRPTVEAVIVAATEVEIIPEHYGPPEKATFELSTATLGVSLTQICGQASRLASSNLCSALCDPDRVVARIISDGTEGGSCVDYDCALSGNLDVNVAVCLP